MSGEVEGSLAFGRELTQVFKLTSARFIAVTLFKHGGVA